jgi:phosphoenolpyruvate carboxykinase (GTP)
MQIEAYGKEPGISDKLFDILRKQKEGLLALKKIYGSVVTPSQLEEF